MSEHQHPTDRLLLGGVDTHKDLQMVAVVDEHDHVLGTECFASTRQGYRQMLAWMRSYGEVIRVGVECTGTYSASLLRFLQKSGVTVLEVTTPDKTDRRKRGKDDVIDAQNGRPCRLRWHAHGDTQEPGRHD